MFGAGITSMRVTGFIFYANFIQIDVYHISSLAVKFHIICHVRFIPMNQISHSFYTMAWIVPKFIRHRKLFYNSPLCKLPGPCKVE